MFAAYLDDGFVLLHSFVKKTQKTPVAEIDKTKREFARFVEEMKKKEE